MVTYLITYAKNGQPENDTYGAAVILQSEDRVGVINLFDVLYPDCTIYQIYNNDAGRIEFDRNAKGE